MAVWRRYATLSGVTDPQPAPARPKKPPIWFLILAAALTVSCCIGGIVIATGGDGAGDPRTATIVACEGAVKTILKSPASAKFSDQTSVKNGDAYTVTGAVDAQNTFGVMIRNRWACTATSEGKNWRATARLLD